MSEIRKKLLVSSIKNSFKYQKRIDGILLKFVKDEQRISSLKSVLTKVDVFSTIIEMIDSGNFFNRDFGDVLLDIWETLSHDQQKQIFKTMFKSFAKENYNSFSECSWWVFEMCKSPMGELLYDISFLETLPGHSGKKFGLAFGFNAIDTDYQKIDYNRIFLDDKLFNYYLEETDVFRYNWEVKNFSEAQKKKLIENGEFWILQFSELKNDISFVENILINFSEEIGPSFFEKIPESVKKNSRIKLAALLSNNSLLPQFVDNQTIINNLYFLRDYDKTSKIMSDKYGYDKILYALCTKNDFEKSGFVTYTTGVDEYYIWDILPEEEKKNYSLLDSYNEESKIYKIGLCRDSNSIVNRNNFYKVMKINNNELNLGVSNNKILSVLNKNPNITNILAQQEELNPVAANNLYYAIYNDVLDVFIDFCNLGIATKVNMKLINKELIEKMGYDIIRNVASYPESFYYLLMLERNGKLDIYKKMLKMADNLNLDKIRISNILVYTFASYENFINQLISKNELNNENLLKLINMTQTFSLVNSNECNSIIEYFEKSDKFCDENILMSNSPLVCRELLCQRFFENGYNETIKFYDSFVCSQHKIKDPNIKSIFEIIKKLKDCENIEIIKELYRTLQQSNFKLDSVGLFAITEQLKNEIIGNLVENTIINNQENNVIDYTGKKFKFLIHVMGAYGSLVPANNVYESWNSNVKILNTGICTSLLNENYFGHARTDEHSVIFGFDNISSSEIQLMGPYDLYSNAYGLKTFCMRESKYYDSVDLINNTRAYHNEVVINRNLAGGDKRQPSYILCFDTINEDSKKASKQFEIPIVFVDVKKHLEIKLQEIETLKQSFVNTQSIDTLKKIINMQETMKCGLLCNNKHLAETFFSSEKITNNILFLIDNCSEIEVLDELEILINNEKNRNQEVNDYRNVSFNADLDLILNRLSSKRQDLVSAYALSEFKEARKKQMQQDQVIREKKLVDFTQKMFEKKEGNILK